jgi:opacity protein-like surface antigen
MTTDVREFPYMDKQTQMIVLFSGMLGLTLAVLTAKPKKAADAVVAVLAGLFGALIIAPAMAEGLTTLSAKYAMFAWADAHPETSLFAAIVGFGGMLGFQICTALKDNLIDLIVAYAERRLSKHDDSTDKKHR